MRGARLFPPKWRGGKKKENIVENHLQFRHVQLADNREGWGGEGDTFIKAPNVTG